MNLSQVRINANVALLKMYVFETCRCIRTLRVKCVSACIPNVVGICACSGNSRAGSWFQAADFSLHPGGEVLTV